MMEACPSMAILLKGWKSEIEKGEDWNGKRSLTFLLLKGMRLQQNKVFILIGKAIYKLWEVSFGVDERLDM